MTSSYALIPAGGIGSRMGSELPKQYLAVAGIPMLQRVLETFASVPAIRHVFVVVSEHDGMIENILKSLNALASRISVLTVGGPTRRDTVLNGLDAMRRHIEIEADDWVLVHDAARPGLTTSMIDVLIGLMSNHAVGGLLALPVVDTVKQADAEFHSVATLNREGMWLAQTPQMFRYALLQKALSQDGVFTDEASAVEAMGLRPGLVLGSRRNLKITTPDDLLIAEFYLTSTGST